MSLHDLDSLPEDVQALLVQSMLQGPQRCVHCGSPTMTRDVFITTDAKFGAPPGKQRYLVTPCARGICLTRTISGRSPTSSGQSS